MVIAKRRTGREGREGKAKATVSPVPARRESTLHHCITFCITAFSSDAGFYEHGEEEREEFSKTCGREENQFTDEVPNMSVTYN